MYNFEIDIEIAEHNLKTMELNKELIKTPSEIEREKEMVEPFSLSNTIKNFKPDSDSKDPKEYFIYHPEV